MNNPGRMIGFLILAQFIGGISVNVFLTAPLFNTPGFAVNGAIYSQQIGLSVLLGLMTSGMAVAIAITGFPVFRAHSQTLALWFIVLSAVSLALSAVEYMNMMSLVSYSEAYTAASGASRDLLEAARILVSSSRNWAHYVGLIFSGLSLLFFYSILYRSKLVPHILAAFGIVAVLLQLITVSMTLFGHKVIFPMLAPLALTQITLALLLIVKGFRESESLKSKKTISDY